MLIYNYCVVSDRKWYTFNLLKTFDNREKSGFNFHKHVIEWYFQLCKIARYHPSESRYPFSGNYLNYKLNFKQKNVLWNYCDELFYICFSNRYKFYRTSDVKLFSDITVFTVPFTRKHPFLKLKRPDKRSKNIYDDFRI